MRAITLRVAGAPGWLMILAFVIAGVGSPGGNADAGEPGSGSSAQTPPAASQSEVQELRERVLELERQLRALTQAQQPPPAPAAAPAPAGAAAVAEAPAPEQAEAQPGPLSPAAVKEVAKQVIAELPVKLGGSIKLRSDTVDVADDTDLLEDDRDSAMRGQLRLWALYNSPEGVVNGGFRLAAGETPNPAGSFARLGNVFEPESVGFDQFYIGLRPFKNLEALGFTARKMPLQLESLALTGGKMPLPFWRGDKGPYRTQMVWDNDISPVGVAVSDTLYRGSFDDAWPIQLDNTFGSFVLQDTPDIRFNGLTGETYLIADQLHFDTPHVGLAVAYYGYHNLNAGLRAPSFDPGAGAFVQPGRSAILLRDGLQRTNNQVNYGTGAEGFTEDHFNIVNLTSQFAWPVPFPNDREGRPLRFVEDLGFPQFFVLADYVHNFTVDRDQDGYYTGAGFYGGGWKRGLHPWEIHFLWGNVDADATLATFANSDLGGGTDYRGWEIGWNYRITKNLQFLMWYFDYDGAPQKDAFVKRLYIDFGLEF